MFSKPEIQELLKQYELVRLYTDKVPEWYVKDADRQKKFATVNSEFEQKAFGELRQPLYVILDPSAGPNAIREVARYDEGKINDPQVFAKFLQDSLGEGEDRVSSAR